MQKTRNIAKTTAVLLALALGAGAADAKGCLEGAAVGGVAGHVAGDHGLIGAAGGCAIGHHEAAKKDKEKAAAQQSQANAQAASNNAAQASAPADKK